MPTAPRRAALPLAAALALSSCADEEILHGLAEPQANEVIVALEDGGIPARKRPDGGSQPGWTIEVARREAARAQRLLAARELPRPRAPGFAEVFGKGGMIPTATEEHALYLHALAGELARSVEAVDGVIEARVHLGVPEVDPLRGGQPRPPRAAVLVKCRPDACDAVRALEGGIRLLVAGAADGLEPSAVSVVIAPGRDAPAAVPAPPRRSPALLWAAGAAALAAAGIGALALRGRGRKDAAA
jgi:type III secretion protein J